MLYRDTERRTKRVSWRRVLSPILLLLRRTRMTNKTKTLKKKEKTSLFSLEKDEENYLLFPHPSSSDRSDVRRHGREEKENEARIS